MVSQQAIRFEVEGGGQVSALLERPANARLLLVLAHGAGAGMAHPFMQRLTTELASAGVATLRYQFPYMEQGRKFPDPPAVLLATVRAAVQAARVPDHGIPLRRILTCAFVLYLTVINHRAPPASDRRSVPSEALTAPGADATHSRLG